MKIYRLLEVIFGTSPIMNVLMHREEEREQFRVYYRRCHFRDESEDRC